MTGRGKAPGDGGGVRWWPAVAGVVRAVRRRPGRVGGCGVTRAAGRRDLSGWGGRSSAGGWVVGPVVVCRGAGKAFADRGAVGIEFPKG
jgi:hypothetical protein